MLLVHQRHFGTCFVFAVIFIRNNSTYVNGFKRAELVYKYFLASCFPLESNRVPDTSSSLLWNRLWNYLYLDPQVFLTFALPNLFPISWRVKVGGWANGWWILSCWLGSTHHSDWFGLINFHSHALSLISADNLERRFMKGPCRVL